MAEHYDEWTIYPGKGLGWISLDSSLTSILNRLRTGSKLKIDVAFSSTDPVLEPVVVTLPGIGVRLRFDGQEQKLRLIEIVDFSRTIFRVNKIDVVRSLQLSDSVDPSTIGPSFAYLYKKLLGPTHAGEYQAPVARQSNGTYTLSWSGVAATFSLKHKAWSEKVDFVQLLSSSSSSPATSLAIFHGTSWPEARRNLFSSSGPSPPKSSAEDESAERIQDVTVFDDGSMILSRHGRPSLRLILGKTTTQDLVSDLGSPDAIYLKSCRGVDVQSTNEARSRRATDSSERNVHNRRSSYTSGSEDERAVTDEDLSADGEDAFYNYFHHGLDVLVARPKPICSTNGILLTTAHQVASKIIVHGNVPGSYVFGRHSRCRWQIKLGDRNDPTVITSEMRFAEISSILRHYWADQYDSAEEAEKMWRSMVLTRSLEDSPDSSIELLGEFEPETSVSGTKSLKGANTADNLGNTKLYGFPGILFEVLKDGNISAVTIYDPGSR